MRKRSWVFLSISISAIGGSGFMTIQEEILQCKQQKDAIILAHYYVRPEIQESAD